MIINPRNIKLWSTLGPRATFGLTLFELANKIENLVVLTCDVSTSAGLDRFRKTYKDKYIELGISEQNLIGVAAGLASENFNVVTTTFAPFQTMRCCEQIKVNLGYMQNKICMVGLASGLVLGTLGYTHCCIEDVSILRSIPNITIITPADCLETVKAVEASFNHTESIYIRLTGASNNSIVYKEDYEFEIGKAITIKNGSDVCIITNGTMVYESMESAKHLDSKGISTGVINMHTTKPIDKNIINSQAIKSKLIVTIEEHNILGGLGSAVSEVLTQMEGSPRQLILGIPDTYSKGGEYFFLKQKFGLTKEQISEKIINNYG